MTSRVLTHKILQQAIICTINHRKCVNLTLLHTFSDGTRFRFTLKIGYCHKT